jgi:hypothetical protein
MGREQWDGFLDRQNRAASARRRRSRRTFTRKWRATDGQRNQLLYEDSIKDRFPTSESAASPTSESAVSPTKEREVRWSNSSTLLLPKTPPKPIARPDPGETRELRFSQRSQELTRGKESLLARCERDFADFLHDYRASQRQMSDRAKYYEEQEDRA